MRVVDKGEEAESTSQNLVEETICDVFATGCCSAIKGTKVFAFANVENKITDAVHREALDETLNQSFNLWSQSDTFMQVLCERIFDEPGFITTMDVFLRQRVITVVEEELKREPQGTR